MCLNRIQTLDINNIPLRDKCHRCTLWPSYTFNLKIYSQEKKKKKWPGLAHEHSISRQTSPALAITTDTHQPASLQTQKSNTYRTEPSS